jgi:hypothetical protein
MLLGGIGALASLALLWLVFTTTRSQVHAAVASWGSVGELQFLSLSQGVVLVASGFVVGGLSGLVASRATRTSSI